MKNLDNTTTLQNLKKTAQQLVQERDWTQFHSPKNLSMKIAIEAGELMEKFVWISSEASFQEVEKNRAEIEDEMADVFGALLHFCNAANIDMTSAFLKKLEDVKQKYPIEKFKGRHEKYNKL